VDEKEDEDYITSCFGPGRVRSTELGCMGLETARDLCLTWLMPRIDFPEDVLEDVSRRVDVGVLKVVSNAGGLSPAGTG
jgi:hypothetical protein